MQDAKKSILKSYRSITIRYDVVSYDTDPDTRYRGCFRFPSLNTLVNEESVGQLLWLLGPMTPNGLWEKSERRKQGERFLGPPLPKTGTLKIKSFFRAGKWEMNLLDENVQLQKSKRDPVNDVLQPKDAEKNGQCNLDDSNTGGDPKPSGSSRGHKYAAAMSHNKQQHRNKFRKRR